MMKAKFFTHATAIVLFLAIIGAVFFLQAHVAKAKHAKEKTLAAKNVADTSSLPAPTPSPSPTSSPSPTPSKQAQPLSGFCLNVPVLLYHHIEPMAQATSEKHASLTVDSGTFDKQMSYLAATGYQAISAQALAQTLANHQKLPAKSVVLTFDDGYADFYTYAYPIVQKYHLTASLMIPTGLITNPGYLNWNQLKEMAASGLVFAYDHTWSHSSLPADTTEKAQFEILTAKKQLEENLGKPVDIFAYPYGSGNARDVALLKSDGFIGAFSTIPGFWQCDSYLMSLHRNRIGNSSLASYGL